MENGRFGKVKNTSFKDELYEKLFGNGVKYINVDRDAVDKGVPATAVSVFTEKGTHEFSFAKANHMDADHMAKVIISYLRNRT